MPLWRAAWESASFGSKTWPFLDRNRPYFPGSVFDLTWADDKIGRFPVCMQFPPRINTDGHGFLTAKHAKYTKYFDANSANSRESDLAAKERIETYFTFSLPKFNFQELYRTSPIFSAFTSICPIEITRRYLKLPKITEIWFFWLIPGCSWNGQWTVQPRRAVDEDVFVLETRNAPPPHSDETKPILMSKNWGIVHRLAVNASTFFKKLLWHKMRHFKAKVEKHF